MKEIKAGNNIEIYDSCSQINMIEEVVEIKGDLIVSIRENWEGKYDERFTNISDIKNIY